MNVNILDLVRAIPEASIAAFPPPFKTTRRKCAYCGRTSLNPAAEVCGGCAAPLQESK